MSLPASNSVDLNQYFYADGTTYAYNGNGYSSYASGWFRMFVLRDPWAPSAGPLSSSSLCLKA